jgi:hypothetical protein
LSDIPAPIVRSTCGKYLHILKSFVELASSCDITILFIALPAAEFLLSNGVYFYFFFFMFWSGMGTKDREHKFYNAAILGQNEARRLCVGMFHNLDDPLPSFGWGVWVLMSAFGNGS